MPAAKQATVGPCHKNGGNKGGFCGGNHGDHGDQPVQQGDRMFLSRSFFTVEEFEERKRKLV